jgi:hypothetical protein
MREVLNAVERVQIVGLIVALRHCFSPWLLGSVDSFSANLTGVKPQVVFFNCPYRRDLTQEKHLKNVLTHTSTKESNPC